MKLLTIAAALAAGVAARCVYKAVRAARPQSDAQQTGVYELEPHEAIIEDADDAEDESVLDAPATCRAVVEESCRAMDVITLQGASRVTFRTEADEKLKFLIPGDNGHYLQKGDAGQLEYRGQTFICFTKDSGEIVGAMYHVAAEDAEEA